MSSTHQFGDLGTQLIIESKRSTQTDTLLKYNDLLIRRIIREQRDLEKLVASSLQYAESQSGNSLDIKPSTLIYQAVIIRNKRCLLAYHTHRLDRLRDLFWAVGGALPHLLSTTANNPQSIRDKLSPTEVDYLRAYAMSLNVFRSSFSAGQGQGQQESDIDITSSILMPPKDLHVLVKVMREECGVVQTELGAIDFTKRGARVMCRRMDVEHLIVQGYLEEV